MLTFLSPAWIEALDAAARQDTSLAALTTDLSLVIEQRVTGMPAFPDSQGGGGAVGGDGLGGDTLGEVTYHVTLRHGAVSVAPGPAADPTIRFSQDFETAAAIAMREGSAQRAFMTGRLRIGGDLRVLLAHGEVLAQLADVFATVREDTVLPAGVA